MKRIWGHIWAASFTAGVAAVTLPACTHDDTSMYIIQIVQPPVSTGTACIYPTPSIGIQGLLRGRLDVGVARTYSPVAMVGSQLMTRSDTPTVRVEANRIVLHGVISRVTDADGNQVANFTSYTEAVIDPGTGAQAGLGQAQVTLLDNATVTALREGGKFPTRGVKHTYIAYFRVFGQTLGGVYIESAEYQHVIDVCNGCLVDFPPEAIDTKASALNCLVPKTAAVAQPCEVGNDQPTDCRLCQGVKACDPTVP